MQVPHDEHDSRCEERETADEHDESERVPPTVGQCGEPLRGGWEGGFGGLFRIVFAEGVAAAYGGEDAANPSEEGCADGEDRSARPHECLPLVDEVDELGEGFAHCRLPFVLSCVLS